MSDGETKRSPTWVWFILNFPFGATSGFVAVTLGFLVTEVLPSGYAGMFAATLVSMSTLPHVFKPLWAPLIDITLDRKKWFRIANLVSSFTIASLGFIRLDYEHMPLLIAIIVVNSVFVSFFGMAIEGLMVHTTAPEDMGKAAGWFQAGNLGGNGLGGGLALLIATKIDPRVASIVTGVLLLACSLALQIVPDFVETRAATAKAAVVGVLKDVWSIIGRRSGIVAIALCLFPMCAGAAANLFSTMGPAWGADENVVAVTGGLLSGGMSAVGCLVGGLISDRMSRRNAYLLSGVLLALVALAMAVLPQNPYVYAVCVCAYNFASGICYGTFTGFVLAIIGKGAAATKYNVLAAMSNIPLVYMGLAIGSLGDSESWSAALWVDALSGFGGVIVLFAIAYALKVGGRDGETVREHPEVSASDARLMP